MLIYVIVYDIPVDKRRYKVADLLSGYGQRVQFSVFECALPVAKYQELRDRLKQRINKSEDCVRFYPISSHTHSQVEIWGGPDLIKVPGSVVV
ncbi:MAG: CRISPR-associated endonuclease Cas2 [Synechococcales bacterium]|nr:CRISPR-associated endonuclease Cas2 [Synechococcales bacterium]